MFDSEGKKNKKQAGAELGQAQFSLVRVVDEVTVIFNSDKVEIEVIVELSLLFLVGREKNEFNAILNSGGYILPTN